MSSYDALGETAQRIYEKAIKKHLEEAYDVFWVDGRWQQFARDETAEDIQRYITVAEMEFSRIPAAFADFIGMPDPGNLTDAVNQMKEVLRALSVGKEGLQDPGTGDLYPFNTELKAMTTSADYLDEWDGLAVLEFRENFIDKFTERTLNQFNAAAVLLNALRAAKLMWKEARENVVAIADEVETAMESASSSINWKAVLTVAGAVIGGPLSVGAKGVTAVALSAVTAATDVGAGAVEEPMNGKTALEIAGELDTTLERLKSETTKAEQRIDDALREANATLTSQLTDYVAPEPQLAQPGPDVGRPDSD